jgi:hypothetical protein
VNPRRIRFFRSPLTTKFAIRTSLKRFRRTSADAPGPQPTANPQRHIAPSKPTFRAPDLQHARLVPEQLADCVGGKVLRFSQFSRREMLFHRGYRLDCKRSECRTFVPEFFASQKNGKQLLGSYFPGCGVRVKQ